MIILTSPCRTTPPTSTNDDTPSKSEPEPEPETESVAVSPPPVSDSLVAQDKEIVVDDSPREAVESSAIMVENIYEDEDSDLVTPVQKRKRASINYNLDDPQYNSTPRESPVDEPLAKRPKPIKGIRGCLIGVWRDSNLPRDEEKHAVYGFIDIHDRLRTRIYPINSRGEELIANIPTGAGGCWRMQVIAFLLFISFPQAELLCKIGSKAEAIMELATSGLGKMYNSRTERTNSSGQNEELLYKKLEERCNELEESCWAQKLEITLYSLLFDLTF
ncbi:hypothetical protein F5884DRAFT_905929 [Xylogone sp. PMI_703]|nr:hypothetical protein F5884DRAFT_905929 [Xylogone sp. PMI_703]